MRADISIFCDGGLGNRINALVSGLAVARYFGLTYCVHWPINNWCAAPFQKIFANRLNVSTDSISQLKGMLGDAVMLLHDEIASNTLGVKFDSAYRFKNLQDFGEVALHKNKTIFFYPALIPNWIPEELVHKELKFLKFDPYIVREVKEFISKTMPGPFYGLHLRRTDLNVGLDDLEVFNLAKSHPESTFFVCSDDPAAEQLAAGHQNVFRRGKKFQIEKKTISGDWFAQTHDDDGRLYYGNIQRNEEAVVEGAIDMLILAHSQIVGFSGSTFQTMARNIGIYSPLIDIDMPSPIYFISSIELEKKLKNNKLDINIALKLIKAKENKYQIMKLLQIILKHCDEKNRSHVVFEIGMHYIDSNEFSIAEIYLQNVIDHQSDHVVARLYLTLSQLMIKKYQSANLNYSQLKNNFKSNLSMYKEIIEFVENSLKNKVVA